MSQGRPSDLFRRHQIVRKEVSEAEVEEFQRPTRQQRTPGPKLEKRRLIQLSSVRSRDMTWYEHLVMLLQIGAGVEHGLMVQYLYAAYSMDETAVPEKHKEHRASVARWRASLIAVAMEEMGHLLTLQNVLTFIGAPVSLTRGDFPWDAKYYPFPFRLEPLSDQSLACYVYAEMPDLEQLKQFRKGDGRYSGRYRRFLDEDERDITDAIQQRDATPHQVGSLYREIIGLMQDERWIRASVFRPETYDFQASADDWGRNYQATESPKDARNASEFPPLVLISRMKTREEAVEALKLIATQGEGPQAGGTDTPSHFDRLLEIYQDYRTARAGETWRISRDVPVNPSTIQHEDVGNEGDFIKSHRARYWGYLFNLRYRLLLTYLTHSFKLAREVPEEKAGKANAKAAAEKVDRKTGKKAGKKPDEKPDEKPSARMAVMHRIFGEMYNIKAIAHILVHMRFSDARSVISHSDPTWAGPPFEMPYSLRLPYEDIGCWEVYLGMFDTARNLGRVLRGGPDEQANAYLTALLHQDGRSRVWINEMLSDLKARQKALQKRPS